jgi:hypothetical protein
MESRHTFGDYFDYKFDGWCDLIEYLKVIYCIDFYHKDLSEYLCDVIKNGTLDFRELNDDLIFVWAIQNFHTKVLESLKNLIFAKNTEN